MRPASATADTATLLLAGERLVLLPDRAVWWPARRALLVADVHLGKGAVFRRAGLAVPTGGSADDIARLDALVASHGAEELIVLGDLVHGRTHADEPAVRALAAWRLRRPSLAVRVVRGNHDRHGVDGLHGLVEWIDDPSIVGPLVLRHTPEPHAHGPVLAGHMHPVMRLPDGLRVAVFWQQAHGLTLPSFGRFTGGHRITPGPAERAWAAGDTAVVSLTPDLTEDDPCPMPQATPSMS